MPSYCHYCACAKRISGRASLQSSELPSTVVIQTQAAVHVLSAHANVLKLLQCNLKAQSGTGGGVSGGKQASNRAAAPHSSWCAYFVSVHANVLKLQCDLVTQYATVCVMVCTQSVDVKPYAVSCSQCAEVAV